MAESPSMAILLQSLTQSISSARESIPKVAALAPPEDGVSLLDIKNELLLAYVQHLSFLVLLRLRRARGSKTDTQTADDEPADSVTSRLVELRLYLEKGTRPLEQRMRYQMDMLLRAADEAEKKARATTKAKTDRDNGGSDQDSDAQSGSENGDGADRETDASEVEAEDNESGEKQEGEYTDSEDEQAARPRLSSLIAPRSASGTEAAEDDRPDGIYRPPKRERVLMDTPQTGASRRDRGERRPKKSSTMDEFVATELADAPAAEPSIGTNLEGRGRRVKTAGDRAAEAERREYEESHFTRLPKPGKKERAKQRASEGRRMAFGGEEFRDIGGQVDRIDRLTHGKDGGKGAGVRALLEKSRKRDRESLGGGQQIGERFGKKLKVMESGRRDRGKGRK